MSKGAANKVAATDLSRFCKSTFTLTFAVEILGIDMWHDCNEGWMDLGQYVQGMKIQYQLYPGQTFDLDVLIWPHAVKIWCGSQYGWVRAWQFLERRWFTFSIHHAFPVRVMDFQNHVMTVTSSVGTGSLSANAKNDKNFEVMFPPLGFAERRYFAPIFESEESLMTFVMELIWRAVVEYIPASCLDGLFDVPLPVEDVRHQDAALRYVQETILERMQPEEVDDPPEVEDVRPRDRRESKIPKEKEKKKVVEAVKVKFEIKITGDSILAGTGRIVPFETCGDRPPDLGEIIVLISSNNLPAQDDYPIVFVNVDNLCGIPLSEFKDLRITQLYTRWKIGKEEHDSQPQQLKSKTDISFNDHHAIALPYELVSTVMDGFYDDCYEIQIDRPQLEDEDLNQIIFTWRTRRWLDVVLSPLRSPASPCASTSSASSLSVNLYPQTDLTLLLHNSPDGQIILKQDKDKPLGEQYRKILTRIISKEILKHDPKTQVTSTTYINWLQEIKRLFPLENLDCFYTGPKAGLQRAHGRLFDAVGNLKANSPAYLLPTLTVTVTLRGIRTPLKFPTPNLFGYQKGDRFFDSSLPKTSNTELDFLIAVTKIHARRLAKAMNSLVRGEYPLHPPMTSIRDLGRELVCTNDINAIGIPVEPDLIVKPDLVLLAQMTLEVCIGLVGCKSRQQVQCFSRMFSLIRNSDAMSSILRYITTINEDVMETEKRDDLLTGFVIDTGDIAILFVEGPKDGHILHVWDMTEDFYPIVKPLFSCSVRYSARIYPDLLVATAPFSVLKMFVPLGVLLSCPPVYARPALPLPTRSAVLKIGRLIAGKFQFAPSRSEMPTSSELKSFRLELCVAPRPIPVFITENLLNRTDRSSLEQQKPLNASVSRINWDK